MTSQLAETFFRAVATLVRDLETWFQSQGRDYPWRRTRDPYAILVSEVMLQQTQIATVLDRGFYSRWMERFPGFAELARAEETEVLSAWQGLGYYRRARNLQRLAQVVVKEHAGEFPREPALIRALPGIGPYTAGAVASFAFGLAEPLVDGNVARVLSRLDDDSTPVDGTAGSRRLWERATELVRASDDPRAFNSALMELGQTVCRPARPVCGDCPVRKHCRTKNPEKLPVKSARPGVTAVTERVFFLRKAGRVLLEQETGSRRTGMWKLPALPDERLDRPPPVLMKTVYGITRYKVTLWVHEAPGQVKPQPHQRLVAPEELPELPMPSPYRRALEQLMKGGVFRLE